MHSNVSSLTFMHIGMFEIRSRAKRVVLAYVPIRQVFLDPPHHFSPNSKNDDFTVLYAYEMKIW